MGADRRIADVQPFAELARSPATVVYKAFQPACDRFVLLKMLRPEACLDEALVARFTEEARLAAQIQHPNVVAIYDAGDDAGRAYLIAEYVEGTDLEALLTDHGPLPPELAAYIGLEAAQGLAAAHAHGILHRDLKPSNLMLDQDGRVKLTDFGMASLVESEALPEVRGTPPYLAPELVRGTPPTAAADQFALGATLYEGLAGSPAFAGAATSDVLDALLHDDPLPRLERRVAVPEALHRILERLLAKDPADRYPDADTLADALADAGPATAADLAAYLRDPTRYRARPARHTPGTVPTAETRAAHTPAWRRAPLAWGLALGGTLLIATLSLLMADAPSPDEPARTAALAERAPPPAQPPAPDPDASAPRESAPAIGPALSDTAAVRIENPAPIPPEPLAIDRPDTTESGETPFEVPALVPPDTLAAAPRQGPGTVRLDCAPWCRVFREGALLGTSPLTLELLPGTYRLDLRNPSFPDHTIPVTVAAGEETATRISLWDLVGRVTFDVRPWAEVVVADTLWGEVPLKRTPLVLWPGTHRLGLRSPAGTWDTTLTVAPGSQHRVRHTFVRSSR